MLTSRRVSLLSKTLVAICLFGGMGCELDSALKHRCQRDSDCLSGRVCTRNVCEPQSSAARPNYVFVTSQKYPPRFQPIELADEKCNAAATDAGLPGEYRAWLSTAGTYAFERLSGARSWVRPDGAPFADTVDDIVAGHILMPPMVDEFGHQLTAGSMTADAVATGTNPFGLVDPGNNCHDFANDEAGNLTAGYPIATKELWTDATPVPCGIPMRLYCFGVDQNAPLPRPKEPGKGAFVSALSFQPDHGIGAADALCADEAAAAGLQGQFLALLATTTASAASRFDADPAAAVWTRVDGVALNAPGLDLFGGGLLRAPLNVSSSGEYIGYSADRLVVTGAANPRAVPDVSENCANWTTSDITAEGGAAVRIDRWFFDMNALCSAFARVYCLEH
jgi:hypothetical protein